MIKTEKKLIVHTPVVLEDRQTRRRRRRRRVEGRVKAKETERKKKTRALSTHSKPATIWWFRGHEFEFAFTQRQLVNTILRLLSLFSINELSLSLYSKNTFFLSCYQTPPITTCLARHLNSKQTHLMM